MKIEEACDFVWKYYNNARLHPGLEYESWPDGSCVWNCYPRLHGVPHIAMAYIEARYSNYIVLPISCR